MALDFFAGCVGGCAGVLVGHPFDTVKVRLQTQHASSAMYRGTIHCFVSTIKTESVFGLYKGMASPMYGLAAINAIVFGVQANIQRRLSNPDTLTSHFIAGSLAGLAQCIICGPMELAKTRMQTQGQGESMQHLKGHSIYKGPFDCLVKIYKTEGFRGTMRGMGLTIVRETPSFGAYFATYEALCQLFDNNNGKDLSTPKLLVAGGCSGMVSWFVTYPVDVIKSRVQNDMKNEYSGAIDCVKKTYLEEGMAGFSRGLGATMVRAFPVNAATFGAVSWTIRLLSKEEDDASFELSNVCEVPKHHLPHSHVPPAVITSYSTHP